MEEVVAGEVLGCNRLVEVNRLVDESILSGCSKDQGNAFSVLAAHLFEYVGGKCPACGAPISRSQVSTGKKAEVALGRVCAQDLVDAACFEICRQKLKEL